MKRFLVVIPIFLLIVLGACGTASGQVNSEMGTAVAQTQTASIWTPTPVTPSPTTVPKGAVIVDALNNVVRDSDPLGSAIDVKFYITDVGFDPAGNPPIMTTMRIQIECEWVLKPACTTERAFVVLMHAFENNGARKKMIEQMPPTIQFVQVNATDHLAPIGAIVVRWQDVIAFTSNDITGDQLAVRAIRLNP
jgi:hypothetical protein